MKIEKLRFNSDFLEVLMDNLETRILIVNGNAEVKEFNKSLMEMIGIDGDDIYGDCIYGEKCGTLINCCNVIEEKKECGQTSQCSVCQIRNSIINALINNIPTIKTIISKDCYISGEKYTKYFLYSCKKIVYENEDAVLMILDDITELEKSRKNFHHLSITDDLTGIFNRRFLFETLKKEKERSDRSGRIYSLMIMDIDHFKKVNDAYGHLAGDSVLKKISLTIKNQFRSMDTFGRFGGEEFMLLLPEVELDEAYLCAERIRKSIEEINFPMMDSPVTISIGVGQSSKGVDVEDLINRVDMALYRAKDKGRNRVEAAENGKTL